VRPLRSTPGPERSVLYDRPLAADPVSGAASAAIDVGGRTLYALSDGFMVMSEDMVGTPDDWQAGHRALAAEYGTPRMPVGCFFLPGDVNVLIDTGLGPVDFAGRGTMIGGKLVPALAGLGVQPEDIDIVALSHLHADHSGGLGELGTGAPVFPNAEVYVGAADWSYFVTQERPQVPLDPHTVTVLHHLDRSGRLHLLDGDGDIAPGVRRLAAPGHTPGHSVYCVHDAGERVLLLGDAMYCAQQLANLDWSVSFDVDPAQARRTREHVTKDLAREGGLALGCHFPQLRAARPGG
jgi:glyoxylase-like metal-dependent hydrolase (beta-lactamase superfamily II)